MRTFLKAFLLLVVLGVIVIGGGLLWISSRGFSAREQPSQIEETMARRLRQLATPPDARNRRNPVRRSPEAVRAGLEHFADHCAICHGNDGRGNTEVGLGLYPKAPDMRQSTTQSLTDGDLFYIIENGIRFTGMPGWGHGTREGEEASWKLVHFVRHLPRLTKEELLTMESLNPKSPEELREQAVGGKFLEGKESQPATPDSRHRHPDQ